MPKVNCYKCGKELIKKPSQIKACNHNYCNECKKYCITIKMIEGYEEKFNINMEEWLKEKYIDEKLSIRQIMKLLNTNANNGISKMLKYYNIPLRYGSEAIKNQWEGNDERREWQRNNSSHLQSKEVRDKLRQNMHTKEKHEKSSKYCFVTMCMRSRIHLCRQYYGFNQLRQGARSKREADYRTLD